MGKSKPRGKYQGVSLPVPFIEEIKNHIMKDNKYKSIAEYIREAVREKIESDNHPWYNQKSPPDLTEKEKEADKFFREYIDEKFKNEFEKKTSDIFVKLMKKQIKVKEKKKGKVKK